MNRILQFGIPSLDELFGKQDVSLVHASEILPEAQAWSDAMATSKAAVSEVPASSRLVRDLQQALSVWPKGSEGSSRSMLTLEMRERIAEALNGVLDDADFFRTVREERLLEQISPGPRAQRFREFEDRHGVAEGKDLRYLNRLALDCLFARSLWECRHPMEGYGISLPDREGGTPDSTSLCILGPGGTGKSVLALHLVARYAADAEPGTRVVYASTDFSYEQAGKIWRRFALDDPNGRMIPFRDERPPRWIEEPLDVTLGQYGVLETDETSGVPGDQQHISGYLLRNTSQRPKNAARRAAPAREVAFLDLTTTTAGDDWGFLVRVVADTPMPEDGEPANLLIVDAVEGLEALVGERDAFGEVRSRRSRVAQLLQAAAGKFHVVFIVEEPRAGERHPEEFVTDTVIRLELDVSNNYSRRTLTVVKARGQEHTRGAHRYVIRGGEGSTTGRQQNADDPRVRHGQRRGDTQGYFLVYPSLHYLSREVMRRPARFGQTQPSVETRTPERMGFCIPHLDGMLGEAQLDNERKPPGTAPKVYWPADAPKFYQRQGLPPGSFTALIGDDGTHKGRLGRAFLAGAFEACLQQKSPTPAGELDPDIPVEKGEDTEPTPPLNPKGESSLIIHPEAMGMTVLITTRDLHVDNLVPKLARHLNVSIFSDKTQLEPSDEEWLRELMVPRAICRRLEVHELEAPSLMHIISCAVEEAKLRLSWAPAQEYLSKALTRLTKANLLTVPSNDGPASNVYHTLQELSDSRRHSVDWPHLDRVRQLLDNLLQPRKGGAWSQLIGALPDDQDVQDELAIARQCLVDAQHCLAEARPPRGRRHPDAHRIRLVLDDWSTVRFTYADVDSDPLFLPFLAFYLEREGISTLFVDTQPGTPTEIIRDEKDAELRALAQHHLYTWHTPFFGERRVAIAALPPISDEIPVLLRELLPARGEDDERLEVDPHFELYDGLEQGTPDMVPLEVRLHTETEQDATHVREVNDLLSRIFRPWTGKDVVTCETVQSYEKLRDFCYLQRDTRLNYTLIFQVDEFWSQHRSRLQSQWNYLTADTHDNANDPFGVFQSRDRDGVNGRGRERDRPRYRFFADTGVEYGEDELKTEMRRENWRTVDRVPFTWDFGLLLCRRLLWEQAEDDALPSLSDNKTVGEVWSKCQPPNPDKPFPEQNQGPGVSWVDFLEACSVVAQRATRRGHARTIHPFDVDLCGIETLSCLFLEVWASIVLEKHPGAGEQFFAPDRKSKPGPSLIQLLGQPEGEGEEADPNLDTSKELYLAWLLLNEVLVPGQFSTRQLEHEPRRAEGDAVAARHWFATASPRLELQKADDPIVPVGLPGRYAVRGDWFLAVAGGSRSPRLGAQAVDLLCSRRANFARMQSGMGLPTRRLFDIKGQADQTDPGEIVARGRELFLNMRTSLRVYDAQNELRPLEYAHILSMGARIEPDLGVHRDQFYWLWRSRIHDYDRHARIWSRWIMLVLSRWNQWPGTKENGFSTYRNLYDNKNFSNPTNWKREAGSRWPEFYGACKLLADHLREASK